MTGHVEKKIRQMPKGGRKGGSSFPRITLSDAVVYARKLVSKTHTSAQPIDVIYSGVVGAKGSTGGIRVSALKQYGFLTGDTKSHFAADDLAKRIVSAPHDELNPLYRQAMLRPTVFKKLFDTYHGDTISKAKLKQRAADLKVHPDETPSCVDLYISGMLLAGLVVVDGEQVTHLASTEVEALAKSNDVSAASSDTSEDYGVADEDEPTPLTDTEIREAEVAGNESKEAPNLARRSAPLSPRAVFNVNVTLDSSLDIEKLQKQLDLLKRFGAI